MAPSPSSGLHLEIFTPKSDFFLLDFMTYFITWHDIVELFYYPKWSKIIKSPRWDLNSIFNWINSTEIINLKKKYFLNELIIALRISHGYVCGVHNEGGGQLKWISTRKAAYQIDSNVPRRWTFLLVCCYYFFSFLFVSRWRAAHKSWPRPCTTSDCQLAATNWCLALHNRARHTLLHALPFLTFSGQQGGVCSWPNVKNCGASRQLRASHQTVPLFNFLNFKLLIVICTLHIFIDFNFILILF